MDRRNGRWLAAFLLLVGLAISVGQRRAVTASPSLPIRGAMASTREDRYLPTLHLYRAERDSVYWAFAVGGPFDAGCTVSSGLLPELYLRWTLKSLLATHAFSVSYAVVHYPAGQSLSRFVELVQEAGSTDLEVLWVADGRGPSSVLVKASSDPENELHCVPAEQFNVWMPPPFDSNWAQVGACQAHCGQVLGLAENQRCQTRCEAREGLTPAVDF